MRLLKVNALMLLITISSMPASRQSASHPLWQEPEALLERIVDSVKKKKKEQTRQVFVSVDNFEMPIQTLALE